MVILIIFILLAIYFARTGGAADAALKFKRPFYTLSSSEASAIVMPPYCNMQFHTSDALPDYGLNIKKKFEQFNYFGFYKLRFNSFINQTYSYTYSALNFLEKNKYGYKIILIDSEIGFTANIIAEYFQNELIYFTPKTTIKTRHAIFTICQRNLTKNGLNYDTWRAASLFRKYKLIKSLLGPLPSGLKSGADVARTIIVPNKGNELLISGIEKKNIQTSVFIAQYRTIATKIKYEIRDFYNPPLVYYNNCIIEKRMKTICRALEKMPRPLVFVNNVEYFREMAIYGSHYYTAVPAEIKKLADAAFIKVYEGVPTEGTLIPEDFNNPLLIKTLTKILRPLITTKLSEIWIDPCVPAIMAIKNLYPKCIINVLGAVPVRGVKCHPNTTQPTGLYWILN